MSLTIIYCEVCGKPANIFVKEQPVTKHCSKCGQDIQEGYEKKWLCFEHAIKHLKEKEGN